ncbi:AraC family transcriptional regulator [Bordetella petrii]|uniref:AraC family transcriptional regulator n=1 Tax=Bordetella petrii TaxID=94624 RepID=UPI0037317EED
MDRVPIPGSAPLDLDGHARAGFPVTGVAAEYPAGHAVALHRHDRCQLLYAAEGVIHVSAASGQWMVPPTTGVWLGPQVEHRLVMRSRARVLGIFVAGGGPGLPRADGVINISSLLRALIQRIADAGLAIGAQRHGRLMAALLLEELQRQTTLPFHLPWPAQARLARVCEALAADPGHPHGVDDWAAALAMSARTFHRHFQQDTGMTFGRWRQRLRLMRALDALLRGAPILQVALDHGYQSHSAFTLAFKQHFGLAPSKFMRRGA